MEMMVSLSKLPSLFMSSPNDLSNSTSFFFTESLRGEDAAGSYLRGKMSSADDK
jgi:hypothetical protein